MSYLKRAATQLGQSNDFSGSGEYEIALKPIWPMLIEDQIKLNDFGTSEFLLRNLARSAWTGQLLCARGELYRSRGKPGDLEQAALFYREATVKADVPAAAWRGLGLALARTGDTAGAKIAIDEYLKLNPAAPDKAMLAMIGIVMLKLKLAAVLAVAVDAPVNAKWTLMPETARVVVAKSGMTVVPGPGWNMSSVRPSKKGEVWSYDRPTLNQVEFVAGIGNGEPLVKERNKKREPLPKFSASMLPTDVAQAFEQTQRVLTASPDFAVEAMEPASFAGRQGFRFTYRYTRPDDELTRRGEARGAIVGGKLYMITYSAAALHYFDAHLARAQAIMDSAKLN